mmetsp:Transcript_688/g.1867  ORF Transcript_688/g.1867 Transcript_688/m.1867 type:complete len:632 (-) Transcript_688:213-2108(-)
MNARMFNMLSCFGISKKNSAQAPSAYSPPPISRRAASVPPDVGSLPTGASSRRDTEEPEFDPSFAFVWLRSMPAISAFDVATLQAATANFRRDNLLGEGGFGSVYKGQLADGRRIAVKRLDRHGLQGDKEFMNEVATLNRMSHNSILRLHGVCVQDQHRMCVLALGQCCLRDALDFRKTGTSRLTWTQRIQIALDIAEGLAYMHESMTPAVAHCDITSRNILVMDNMRACISDFGLAMELPRDKEEQMTVEEVRSTFGYIAPELASIGQLSTKADSFSFGVLLLEIFTGQLPVDTSRPKAHHLLVEHMRQLLAGRQAIAEVLDPHMMSDFHEHPRAQLVLLHSVVCACLRSNPSHRSTVSEVLPLLRKLQETALLSEKSSSIRPRDSASEMAGLAQNLSSAKIRTARSVPMQPQPTAQLVSDQPPQGQPRDNMAMSAGPATSIDHGVADSADDNPFAALRSLDVFSAPCSTSLFNLDRLRADIAHGSAGMQEDRNAPSTTGGQTGDNSRQCAQHHSETTVASGRLENPRRLAHREPTQSVPGQLSNDRPSHMHRLRSDRPGTSWEPASASVDITNMCLVCVSGQRTTRLEPCGHGVACCSCAAALTSIAGPCPSCSAPVIGYLADAISSNT